jgi:peptidoglycan-N-acetylglucosamine deacetylase
MGRSHLKRASFEFCVRLGPIMSRRHPAFPLTAIVALSLIQGLSAQTAVSTVPSNSIAQPPQPPVAPPAAVTMPAPAANSAAMGMQKPQSSAPGAERSSYSSIHVDGPYIAMTFDDGPDAVLTPKLLDILKERHIHVTFFVLGQRVADHPEILQRAVAEGHEIGNHSWDHPQLTKLGEGGLQHQMGDTTAVIKQAIGHNPTLMRPPYGATNPRLNHAFEKEYGMKVILWSVDPFDWKNPGSKVVESRILSGWKESGGAKPGAIILSHDIHKGTVDAMPETLDALLAKGYKFVTVSELIAMEKTPTPTPAKKP